MPLIVFDIRGIPAARRQSIVAAVEAGGAHLTESYESWITSDPVGGGVRVQITGPLGFERTVEFAVDEDPSRVSCQTVCRFHRTVMPMREIGGTEVPLGHASDETFYYDSRFRRGRAPSNRVGDMSVDALSAPLQPPRPSGPKSESVLVVPRWLRCSQACLKINAGLGWRTTVRHFESQQ